MCQRGKHIKMQINENEKINEKLRKKRETKKTRNRNKREIEKQLQADSNNCCREVVFKFLSQLCAFLYFCFLFSPVMKKSENGKKKNSKLQRSKRNL